MPRRCCVPGCNSNYDSFLKTNKPVTTFSFPKDEERKKKWLRAIPRKNWMPSASVCADHFNKECVINTQPYNGPNGMQQLLLNCPRLTDDAVPTIFKNLPSYLSKTETPHRTDPEDRRRTTVQRQEQQVEEFLQSDEISDFSDCIKRLENFITTSRGTCWNMITESDMIWLYILNVKSKDSADSGLYVKCSVCINKSLHTKVFLRDVEIPTHDLKWVLPSSSKVSKWSQIENLLIRYKHVSSDTESCDSTEQSLIMAGKYLNRIAENCDGHPFQKHIEVISDQINLLNAKQRRYSPTTILFAFMIFLTSSSTYKLIRDYIILPHKRYLQEITSSLQVSPQNINKHYLKKMAECLNERERYVSLLIDEVYVKGALSFKGNGIVGYAEGSTQIAKTVQSFMINSTFGRFKEIVKLVPVNCLSGKELKDICLQVVQFVQKFGFIVIAVITDNNRINQNMFNFMSANEYINNPDHDKIPTFLTYDSVHIFKNLRNNWINQKDPLKSMTFPDFENPSVTRVACFEHVREFFKREHDLLAKKAYKLNVKSLYPSNLERQCVQYVENIFHDSTIAALGTDKKYEDTVEYLKLIRKWWCVMNSKNCFKGIVKRDEWSGPIADAADMKMKFLKQFISWLRNWNFGKEGALTRDTYKALMRCTSVLINLTEYALKHLNVNYVLAGKLQTDCLEKRFSQYRSLSGCNYNVSYQQILESEKKLKIKKVFEMIRGGKLSLAEMVATGSEDIDVSDELSESITNELSCILPGAYLQDIEHDESAKYYICGYAAQSICRSIECNLCINTFRVSKGSKEGNQYYDTLQRGGLSFPSKHLLTIFEHTSALFQCILKDEELEKKFMMARNQKFILTSLAKMSLQENNFFNEAGYYCECGEDLIVLFVSAISIFVNILLNNFCKIQNECVAKVAKKRKLNTFK